MLLTGASVSASSASVAVYCALYALPGICAPVSVVNVPAYPIVVIASVDTYLRFAEATNRLDLYEKGGNDLPEMVEGMTEGGAKGKTSGVLGAAKDAIMGSDDEDEDEEERQERRPAKKSSSPRPRRARQRES